MKLLGDILFGLLIFFYRVNLQNFRIFIIISNFDFTVLALMASKIKDFVNHGSKIVCVGRNYAKHARELGNALPTTPIIFTKPTTSFVSKGGNIIYPSITSLLHYEVELGVVMGQTTSKISADNIMEHVAGYAICIDVTCRDIQEQCKSERIPWTMAKCLDTFCPVGPFISSNLIDPFNTEITLKVNNELKQHGNSKDMIFSIPSLLEYISRYITLLPGDLVLTGTPEGVGPLEIGDTVTAAIPGITEATFYVK